MNKNCDVYIICPECDRKNYIDNITVFNDYYFNCNHCKNQVNISKAVIKKDDPVEV